MSAYALPWEMPLMSCCRKVSTERVAVAGGVPAAEPLRVDRLDAYELATLDFEHSGGLDRVAVLVDRDRPGDAAEVTGLRERVANRCGLGRVGAPDRIEEDVGGIVRQAGE